MGARAIPRPDTGTPASPEDIFRWLEYLCLNVTSRGLYGYELEECGELLELPSLSTAGGTASERAEAIRQLLRQRYNSAATEPHEEGNPEKATLLLLGLSPLGGTQARPLRRQLAAHAMMLKVDTFQKGYEVDLLRDAAQVLYGWLT